MMMGVARLSIAPQRSKVHTVTVISDLLASGLSTSPHSTCAFVGNQSSFAPHRPGSSSLFKTNQQQVKMKHNNFSASSNGDPSLPTMIVFDLDDCLWSPEMHELPGLPSIPVEGSLNKENLKGVVGLKVPKSHSTVSLFDGARRTLYELATNPKYEGIILASASSSLEPSYSHACLERLEILPGVTMADMFRYNQIGRTGRLSPHKTTHFRLLHEESGVPHEEMLFFDDCNWGDNCGDVTRAYGVVSYRTPNGLQYHEFEAGLKKYRKEAEQLLSSVNFK